MEMDLTLEVKKKKEVSQLPDSLIRRALEICSEDVKETRALLRKFFGVFLTNKVFKLGDESVLNSHISSKGRDYEEFYELLFKEGTQFESVIDIGCGVNGFSYSFVKERLGDVDYVGIEAVGQLVDKMNLFFKEKEYTNAKAICLDVFDLEEIGKSFSEVKSPRAIFLFQVIDALEGFEKDFSKKLLLSLKENISSKDVIFISMPMKSISGKTKFEAKRGWLRWFLEENFQVEEFFIGDERVFECKRKD